MATLDQSGDMDLGEYLKKLRAATTEAQVCDILDRTPKPFQERTWIFLEQFPFDRSLEELVSKSVQEAKKIVWQMAVETNGNSGGFNNWLAGIPLLPSHIVKPLRDHYRSCSMIYENFNDCYSGFDEKSFRDDALKKIQNWLFNIS